MEAEPSAPELERLRGEVARLRRLVEDLGSESSARRRLVAITRELEERKRRGRLSDALTAAVTALQEVTAPDAIFSQAASALEARGFRSILWHVDGDALRVKDIRLVTTALRYLERVSGARAIGYRATLSAVDAYRRAAEMRAPVYVHDGVELLRQIMDDATRWIAPVAVRVAGLRRGIVAPLIQGEEVTGLFVVMDDELEPADCAAVGAFAELMSNAAQRADLVTVRRAPTVADGRRAIDEGDLDLVVSDVRLGDGVGLELRAPCEARALPLILCSGYLELEAVEERIRDEGLPFLRKPFAVEELLALAARLLDARV